MLRSDTDFDYTNRDGDEIYPPPISDRKAGDLVLKWILATKGYNAFHDPLEYGLIPNLREVAYHEHFLGFLDSDSSDHVFMRLFSSELFSLRISPDDHVEKMDRVMPIQVVMSRDASTLIWYGFDEVKDRLGMIQTVVVTDQGVDRELYFPETRIILSWESRTEVNGTLGNIFIEVPLWRTVNVMKKLERCVTEYLQD